MGLGRRPAFEPRNLSQRSRSADKEEAGDGRQIGQVGRPLRARRRVGREKAQKAQKTESEFCHRAHGARTQRKQEGQTGKGFTGGDGGDTGRVRGSRTLKLKAERRRNSRTASGFGVWVNMTDESLWRAETTMVTAKAHYRPPGPLRFTPRFRDVYFPATGRSGIGRLTKRAGGAWARWAAFQSCASCWRVGMPAPTGNSTPSFWRSKTSSMPLTFASS